MKPVTAETVQAEIRRLEAFTACTTRPLSITEEFHLSCLRQLLAVLSAEPVAWVPYVDGNPSKVVTTRSHKVAERWIREGMRVAELVVKP